MDSSHSWRKDFPLIANHTSAYLDNAATTQKPQIVIDAITNYYTTANANIHRGIYQLSEAATQNYEQVRQTVAAWMKAEKDEIVFCRGTTEAINLVAESYGSHHFKPGGDILISALEHHANILPWQHLAKRLQLNIRVIPVDQNGDLDLNQYQSLLSDATQLVAITHISNVLGTVNPIKEMVRLAHEYQIPVLVDGAQAVSHRLIDVKDLGCDFYTFSGHKLFAPTGVGILYASKEMMAKMEPYQVGGGIVQSADYHDSQLLGIPHRFEAGTPNISSVIGLGAALGYLQSQSWQAIEAYESALCCYLIDKLKSIDGLTIVGSPEERIACVSFAMEGVHPHDIATILDTKGVAVRAGHLCAMPLVKHLGYVSLTRASLAFYNSPEEIDRLHQALKTVRRMFHG